MSGVYEGLTVVELADRRNQWAGKLMADGGARVSQIELINGSPGRWCGPFVDDTLGPFGLDYGSVSANRALIDASLTDFGQGGRGATIG